MPVSAEPAAAQPPRDEAELEERLSRPTPALTRLLATVPGDLVVLGAGGKMGPSLARMAKRADPSRRVVAVSRWCDRAAAAALEADGVETIARRPARSARARRAPRRAERRLHGGPEVRHDGQSRPRPGR